MIPGTEPGVVPYPGEGVVTPDPAIDNELLRGIYNNTLATARNTNRTAELLQDGITIPGTDITPIVDAINAQGNAIQDKLADIEEEIPPPIDSLELTGDQPALGDDNVYDTTIEEPEEESLSETILEFINNGLPFVSTLKQNAITLSNPSPSYDFVLYDHQFSFDFSPYESHLRAFGYLLYGLTVFSAFMIIVRR